jgi:hypothetical protein
VSLYASTYIGSSAKVSDVVIPAEAGIQKSLLLLDSRFRGNDGFAVFRAFAEAPIVFPLFSEAKRVEALLNIKI